MVGTNKAGAFQCLGDKYMIEVLDGPKREGASLSLLITKEKELAKDVVVNGVLGCCDHETVEFNVLRKAKGRPKLLGCKRGDTGLLRT